VIIKKALKLAGIIQAPPSKSYTQRVLQLAAFSDGITIIKNPLYSDDTKAAMSLWKQFGAKFSKGKGSQSIKISGVNGLPILRKATVNVKESGTLLRFVLPILCLTKGKITVKGTGTLCNRRNTDLIPPIKKWGVDIKGRGCDHKLPIVIKGIGRIPGGKVKIDGHLTSQGISAFLNVSPLIEKDMEILPIGKVVERPYIDMTMEVLDKFGIKSKKIGNYKKITIKSGQKLIPPRTEISIPGDYSSAAFLIAAACLVKSDITITNLLKDKQGDARIVDILVQMGATIKRQNGQIQIKGPFELEGIDIDGKDIPDLVPILTAVGCFAKGRTRILDIEHVANKESNRITAPSEELRKLGAKIETAKDRIIIYDSRLAFNRNRMAVVNARRDHRIAMMLAVVGLVLGNIKIEGFECFSKTYPGFINDLKKLGAKLKIE